MDNVVLFLALILLSVVLGYWLWFSLSFHRQESNQTGSEYKLPPVSVILCYKNAESHLRKTVDAILKQDYPAFELVAIDDFSSDGSDQVLESVNDERLRKVNATTDHPGKKAALTNGIALAQYDILLFIDADCLPASRYWITSMVQKMMIDDRKEIVLGYGPMTKRAGFLNSFARYETILTAIQYISYAVAGLPYMGVGRNLMYKRQVFDRMNGYSTHLDIASGDDDLMISMAATSKNTTVNLNPDSFVYSEAKKDVISFLNQKSRHISTSFHYTTYHKMLLGLFALSQMLLYVTLMAGWKTGLLSFAVLVSILGIKWTLQMIFQNRFFMVLDGADLKWMFPLLDICMNMYYLYLPVYSLFRKPKW